MRLSIFNCSPRKKLSNTSILAGAFAEGFCQVAGNSFEEFFVADRDSFPKTVSAFAVSESAFIAFPVYVDAMPGIAKAFIEEIGAYRDKCTDLRLLFLIHTGFPEETHTRPMEMYLSRLARRMGTHFDGVIRMGGGEDLQRAGTSRTRKILDRFRILGRSYAENQTLDKAILKDLAGIKAIPPLLALAILPYVNRFAWDRQLKLNGAFEKRFDRPLQSP